MRDLRCSFHNIIEVCSGNEPSNAIRASVFIPVVGKRSDHHYPINKKSITMTTHGKSTIGQRELHHPYGDGIPKLAAAACSMYDGPRCR